MFLFHGKKEKETYRTDTPVIKLSLMGAFAGLLSGLLGIGGVGIISPLMLMPGFNPKKITAITAFLFPFHRSRVFLPIWVMGNIDWKIQLISNSGNERKSLAFR